MRVVYTYYPIQNNNALEYLEYSIRNINKAGVIPVLFSDKNYFAGRLNIEWFPIDVKEEYRHDILWSYPKLLVLSKINFPFIHLDNDFVVSDYNKLMERINSDGETLNLGYKHPLNENQIEPMNHIWKTYYLRNNSISELSNTCLIGTSDYKKINACYQSVLDILDTHYYFFTKRYDGVPPITLNQEYSSILFFKHRINYIAEKNPEFDYLEENGFAHISDKKRYDIFKKSPNII